MEPVVILACLTLFPEIAWPTDSFGIEGIAPFLEMVLAPHALANLDTSLNFFSSCKPKHAKLLVD